MWIECHERMARWYVYMDHRMKCEGMQYSMVYALYALLIIYGLHEACIALAKIEKGQSEYELKSHIILLDRSLGTFSFKDSRTV